VIVVVVIVVVSFFDFLLIDLFDFCGVRIGLHSLMCFTRKMSSTTSSLLSAALCRILLACTAMLRTYGRLSPGKKTSKIFESCVIF
jgi:hypothetical protein